MFAMHQTFETIVDILMSQKSVKNIKISISARLWGEEFAASADMESHPIGEVGGGASAGDGAQAVRGHTPPTLFSR